MTKERFLNSVVEGASVTIVTITVLTVIGDLYDPVKDELKSLFSHHWIGKSVVGIFVFVFVTLLFSQYQKSKPADVHSLSVSLKSLNLLAGLCGAILLLFFIFETLIS